MALVHRATLSPSKQELLEAWLPSRPWAAGTNSVEKVAEYRFDDPAGEVGVETILWRTPDGAVLQVPFTYRAAPLPGAEAFLVGTSDHSVLGMRWVYDGCGDPVWAAAVTAAVLTGGSQAQMYVEDGGQRTDIPARMEVRGSGAPGTPVPDVSSVDDVRDDGSVTTVTAGKVRLSLARVVGTPLSGDASLTGSVGDVELGVLVALADGSSR